MKKLTTPTTDEGSDDTVTTPVENGNGAGSGGTNEDEDSWEQVGRKNKSSTMRKVIFVMEKINFLFFIFIQCTLHVIF